MSSKQGDEFEVVAAEGMDEEYDEDLEESEEEETHEEPKAAPAAPAAAAAGPRGLGLGLGSSLPSRPAAKPAAAAAAAPASASSSTAAPKEASAPAASSSAAPQLPARPVGLPGLPARPGLGGSSLPGAGAAQQQQQAAPAAPAAAAAAAPAAKPAGAALPSLPPRKAPAAPAAAPASSAGPLLPARPAASAAAAPAATSAPAAAAPAAQPKLPARPAAATPALPARPTPAAAAAVAPAAARTVAAVAAPPPPSAEVVDANDTKQAQKLQRQVQDARVRLIRAAGRLGLRYDSDQVTQFLSVIERVERMHSATAYRGTRSADLNKAAEKEARELDSKEAADSRLDIKVKIMVIGLTGTGKSELINSLLEKRVANTNPFHDTTKRIRVIKGRVHGIQLEFIDTPGLHASSTMHAANKALLRKMKAAYKWHKPNYVFYVDRADAARPSLGELTVLGQVNEAFGAQVWQQSMLFLTHAHACRANMGAQYDQYTRQRRSILLQMVRQAASNNMVRNPMFLVDSHPNCPTNSYGQPIILDGGNSIPWKQQVFMQLVGYRLFEEVQALFKEKAAKAKAAGAAQPTQQDLFKQLMRPRLPPVSYYVEQLAEGVLKPDTWAAIDDPFDQETDDEAAEEFQHAYYMTMYQLAKQGHPWAQKEYDMMLKKMDKLKKTYKEVFEDEDLNMMASSGYEGYVAEGLDLGQTFDPEDKTNHRYVYHVEETDWQVMPTLDYYGFEHEDAITGFVAEYEAQVFNRDGWGGFPLDIQLAVEKDKVNTCIQGEGHLSVVHCVPPFGKRHITQFTGSFEYLRPNMKDILYQLEINTFRDGLLAKKDHAGCGLLLVRLGENGNLTKGATGMGVRLQDTMRVGAFKVEACATKVQTDGAGGAKDEAWGGRAFVRYDYLPGLGMLFDFYQHRTKDNEQQVGGLASTFTYDFEMFGAACGVEVDYIGGSDALHVDMKLFSGNDYRLAWLLAIPAWNWLKGTWQRLRNGGGEAELMEEEVEEGEEEEEGGMMFA